MSWFPSTARSLWSHPKYHTKPKKERPAKTFCKKVLQNDPHNARYAKTTRKTTRKMLCTKTQKHAKKKRSAKRPQKPSQKLALRAKNPRSVRKTLTPQEKLSLRKKHSLPEKKHSLYQKNHSPRCRRGRNSSTPSTQTPPRGRSVDRPARATRRGKVRREPRSSSCERTAEKGTTAAAAIAPRSRLQSVLPEIQAYPGMRVALCFCHPGLR